MAVIVWVVVSDCGLNGPQIHGVYTAEPSSELVEACARLARPTTGYQYTSAQRFETDEPPS